MSNKKSGFYAEFDRKIKIENIEDGRKELNMDPATYNYNGDEEIPQRLTLSPIFNAIWDEIKEWDVNVPYAYGGYCAASGSHIHAILKALANAGIIDLAEIQQNAVSNPKSKMLHSPEAPHE